MWGCFLMSGVKILHFLKDWWKSIPIHQNYTMALTTTRILDSKASITQTVISGFQALYYGSIPILKAHISILVLKKHSTSYVSTSLH